jgi:uncharacterized Zn finger protein (UPF0148 family)
MLKLYCTECGGPTSYLDSKPKFCSSCGTSFDKLVVNKVMLQKPTADRPVAPKKISPRLQKITNSEDEDTDLDFDDPEDDINKINSVPPISRLDVEIDQGYQGRKEKTKIGDILGSAKNPSKREKVENKKTTKADRKKFLDDFSREAGALRPKNRGQKDG